jgi:hypothetical protein
MKSASVSLVLAMAVAPCCPAQSLRDVVPAGAPNCAITAPPADAGVVVPPGGFVMVHPRNDAIGDQYTGCKVLWVVDADRLRRIATLYFAGGVLARAVAHDVHDPSGAIDAACDLVSGRSLLPRAGRRATDAACQATPRDELYALRVATLPRRCVTDPDAPPCKADPR